MTADRPWQGLDAGLRNRFHAAGAQIGWRDAEPPAPPPAPAPARGKKRSAAPPAPTPAPSPAKKGTAPPTRSVRIAHLNDEEARVEEAAPGGRPRVVVDSGPVGALVLLLLWDQRGAPSRLVIHEADALTGFPTGAIEAEWGGAATPHALPLSDLVALARYALA